MHILFVSVGILTSQLAISQKDQLNLVEKTSVNLSLSKSIELYNLTRFNDAIALLKKAELMDTANWKIQYWMGKSFYELSIYYAAEECASRALELISRSDDADAGLNELLGNVNQRLGNIDLAAVYFKKTAQLMGTKTAKLNNIFFYIDQCELALKDMKAGIVNIREPLSPMLNTLDAEYAPIVINDGKELIFTA